MTFTVKRKNNLGLSTADLKNMERIFKKIPQLKEVVLFGSRAMGNYKRGSDVDLALKGTIDSNIVFQVHDGLEEETQIPYFFDVLNYHKLANQDLKKHIDEEGKIIWSQ